MTELGARLKEARVSKGYSLEDLQEKTKIQKRYLSAIEEGNYGVMPGTFYVRAFIKQYAEAVDLDANELLETYKSELPTSKVAENLGTGATIQQGAKVTDSRRRSNVAKTASSNKKFSEVMPKFVVAIFIVVAIIVLAYLMINQPDNNAVEEKPAATTQENKTATDTAAEEKAKAEEEAKAKKEAEEKAKAEKEAEQKISAGVVESDGVTTTYNLSNTEEFKIRIDVTGDNWIGLTDEKNATLGSAGMYTTGDKIEEDATGKESVRIRLGAAANGKVFINEKELKLVTPASEQPTQNIVIKLAEKE